jgi:hypothetical protein
MEYSYGDPHSVGDLPESLHARITYRLHLCSTALFRVWIDERGDRQASQIGSGTFVTIRGTHGVLTAQHVPEQLRSADSLGLSAAREGEEHAMIVERNSIRIIEVAPRESDEFGPDLALVVLSDSDDAGTIKASRGFHLLDANTDSQLNRAPPPDGGLWFFSEPHPHATNAVALTIGASFFLGLSAIVGEVSHLPTTSDTWIAFIYLVIVATVRLYYLYLFVLRRWPATVTNDYSFLLFPTSTVVIAAWLLSESITSSS